MASLPARLCTAVLLLLEWNAASAQILNPPYFNLADGRKIHATATCGETSEPELYCKLVGANLDRQDDPDVNLILIQGQVCDYCDAENPKNAHPPENAIDGSEKWWQSPPLSRGNKFNEVNLTIDLGQEFHVAYVFIKMANSPRPGVWVLERSTDNGKTFTPWQYFADTYADCDTYFGPNVEKRITSDGSVICETKFSKVVPLEGGEMIISLLNERPSADNFTYSAVLQEFTKATNIRLRLLRTKTLLGHLMSVQRQDPTVTRRYFYSIKDINIGGRCVCNGHADNCYVSNPDDSYRRLCVCQHNTCGAKCEYCCPGFTQKKWRRASIDDPHVCEACNCFGHSNECIYDEDVDNQRLSVDIHGKYDGGGVCQNCQHNTEGINCNKCKPGYFRPYSKPLNATDVCQPCDCDLAVSSGNCAEGSGQCECRPEFLPPYCDRCNYGYYGYPNCRPCDCNPNGTAADVCEVGGGQCPCKPNYMGKNCDQCASQYYGFPDCLACNCNPQSSLSPYCNNDSGQCDCHNSYGGRDCSQCDAGFYDYPACKFCSCDATGTIDKICDNITGTCLCKEGFGGPRCDQCAPTYFGYPNCQPCECNEKGSSSPVCDNYGKCHCLQSFTGRKCDQCAPGYYKYPECFSCDCDIYGSLGLTCNDEGICYCKPEFDGEKCDSCKKGFYNYPRCEDCNCNPAGIVPTFGGCGSLTSGELCECKERVTGRICDQCKPLYWNLRATNPYGCEECECYVPGTLGGLGVCDDQTGQCFCKPNVGSRQCQECLDGKFILKEDDLFGCEDCQCDIGGSVHGICDKQSGQCPCRPRIKGLRCDSPLQTHFFPTLHQHQYEVEDGRTQSGTAVRFGFDEDLFPGFSWRGYAIFSNIQREILLDLDIKKPGLYQLITRYINLNGEHAYANISFTPDIYGENKQSEIMTLPPTETPTFQKVVGVDGFTAIPFVLNPGKWVLSIEVKKPIFMDYIVLLPQSYYEATLLQDNIKDPCKLRKSQANCLQFRYPSLPEDHSSATGDSGYTADGDNRARTQMFTDEEVLQELGTQSMAWLNVNQRSVKLDLRIRKPGPYVFLALYHTVASNHSVSLELSVADSDNIEKGQAILYNCDYSFLCRQVVLDRHGKILIADIVSNFVSLTVDVKEDDSVAIDRIVAIPFEDWHLDFIIPKEECIKKEGKCLQLEFPPSPQASKVEVESGQNEDRLARVFPPAVTEEDVGLIYLDYEDSMVDVEGSVPHEGTYVFVVHYYQPDHPKFELKVLIQNGQFYEASLPVEYCPSSAGCRAVVQLEQSDTRVFQIFKNFVITLKEPDHKSIWLDYILAIPADLFNENILRPQPHDTANEFIKECGQNSFFIDKNTSDFCKTAVFSLTSEYNNGALPCKCDIYGSLSFECEELGGQCKCKNNVIGRTCSRCRTGYFGFPDCKPCDCPSTAVCHDVTGQCICPPRVKGEQCDTCMENTFGYDPIIGCEECNCNPLGVLRNNLQCNLYSGQCPCKANVESRTCDQCQPGNWGFPYCEFCNCDVRGTTEDICDKETSECFCKENVFGEFCDQCKPGTFFLEESNPLGCTKCFCFGTTDRCASANMYRHQVYDMENWDVVALDIASELTKKYIDVDVESGPLSVKTILPDELEAGILVYFSAPESYLGHKLTSYGGTLAFTITTIVDNEIDFGSLIGADVIISGNNVTLFHDHLEQPAAGLPLEIRIKMVESEFKYLNGKKASRENLMTVLVNIESLYIRASYFHPSKHVLLNSVLLDVADDTYIADSSQALTVEQCHCPPNYQGTSCEACSPGYYRSKPGPYLGFCVPCQCHGHAESCDVNTGKCFDCKHHTTGDHCEKCASGYHGDATQGTPHDCLICACPLPIESNNFAESCEVSPSGQEISCNCKEGYYGPRCDVCDAGYFGQPDLIGSTCEPCKCSGNIDPTNPASCDSVSGECVLCLNNTFGTACGLCAPGFFGDAVSVKDCRQCPCKKCGTSSCDHWSGSCTCHPNVEGELCDRCVPNTWGFESCGGCRPCNCGEASFSDQCNVETGQCPCKPGVDGLTCGHCAPGSWRYSPDGCVSCNCDEKFSAGAVCNQLTGQCQCLPGVIGEKCDSCPHRWVFLEKRGCQACGECVHALLDDTDALQELLHSTVSGLTGVSASYLAYRRLETVNSTVREQRPLVDALKNYSTFGILEPWEDQVIALEINITGLQRKAENHLSYGSHVATSANETQVQALDVYDLIRNVSRQVYDAVDDLRALANALNTGAGLSTEINIREAERILQELELYDFEPFRNQSADELQHASEVLEKAQNFIRLASDNNDTLNDLRGKLKHLEDLQKELKNYIDDLTVMLHNANLFIQQSRNSPIKGILEQTKKMVKTINKTLEEASNLIQQASGFSTSSQAVYSEIGNRAALLSDQKDALQEFKDDTEEELGPTRQRVAEAKQHALNLDRKADELESLFEDRTRDGSTAIQAVTASNRTEELISEAEEVAKAAVKSANEALEISEGQAENANNIRIESEALNNEVTDEKNIVDNELEPKLRASIGLVDLVTNEIADGSQNIDYIEDELRKLPVGETAKNMNNAENKVSDALEKSRETTEKTEDLISSIRNDKDRLEKGVNLSQGVINGVQDAQNYLERVPPIDQFVSKRNKVQDQQNRFRRQNDSLALKIAELRKKIDQARDKANRIELGVTFFGNTTIWLRNPSELKEAWAHSHLAFYFATNESNGFLLYLGNQGESNKRQKRSLSQDFMALEIRNGYVHLVINLGQQTQEVANFRKRVSDGVWYKLTAERTGMTVTLTITAEEDGLPVEYKEIRSISGTKSVLNLDEQKSKFYVGGLPEELAGNFQTPPFIGFMEGLKFAKSHVGLWNFQEGKENVKGCEQRDKLVRILKSNEYQFDGNGYVELSRPRKTTTKNKSAIKLTFKTYASDGLLVYMHKDENNFIAIELNEGYVQLKYNLGEGPNIVQSNETFSPGEWTNVVASRSGKGGQLTVNQLKFGTEEGINEVSNVDLTDSIYIGGIPKEIEDTGIGDIISVGYEGCIKDIEIDTLNYDLSKHKQAFGFVSGCPETFARIISFTEDSPGFIAMKHIDLSGGSQLTFRFKTYQKTGVIFYAANDDHTSFLLIGLEKGHIILHVKPGAKITSLNPCNDGKWHYVTATADLRKLTLNIDDIFTEESRTFAEASVPNSPPIYFGGIPGIEEVAKRLNESLSSFVGCIGDVTVKGDLQNFAASQGSVGVLLERCFIGDAVLETTKPASKPSVPDSGDVKPTPLPNCALPLKAAQDTDINPESGLRFGNTPHSRQEYSLDSTAIASFMETSTISLEFSTTHRNGVLFYVSNDNHMDFIGIFMKDGKINVVFNCGTGSKLLDSSERFSDGEWHTLEFTLRGNVGTLRVDAVELTDNSPGNANSMNVKSPMSVGGLSPNSTSDVKNNLKGVYVSFPGCIRNFQFNDQTLARPNRTIDVIPCSKKVEDGMYFASPGSYAVLYDTFRVGKQFTATFDIKPRRPSGVLLSVHSQDEKDFLLLQLKDGRMILSADNGGGILSVSYGPTETNLCDGQWHSVKVNKAQNVLTIHVDNQGGLPFIGVAGITSADTQDPLYVGGVPNPSKTRAVETTDQFIGCIRHLEIGGKLQNVAESKVVGEVYLNSCPTI